MNSVTSKFMCGCNVGYAGSKCEIDLRPCSYFPCLNSGKCIESINSTFNFTCNCTEYFRGKRCETKIDPCQNETCSSNGYCIDANNTAVCKCFYLYSGLKCETKSVKLTFVKKTQTVSILIVICSGVIVAFVTVVLDLKCCGSKKRKTKKLKPK